MKAPKIPDKLYFSIGEVSELARVEAHVLRYWETQFDVLQPSKNMSSRFDWLDPAEVKKRLERADISPDDRAGLIYQLRTYLKVTSVLFLTVAKRGDRYDINSERVDTTTGKTVGKSDAKSVSPSEISAKLRDTTFSLFTTQGATDQAESPQGEVRSQEHWLGGKR